jgi:hypothetical protein
MTSLVSIWSDPIFWGLTEQEKHMLRSWIRNGYRSPLWFWEIPTGNNE